MQHLIRNKDGFAAVVGAVLSVLVLVVVGLVVYYNVAKNINGLPAAGVTAADHCVM